MHTLLLGPQSEQAPARMIAAFLKRTRQAVPLGTEHRHLDLDRLVSRLVHDAG
ncbi:hypothetical protein [Streptomyces sp. T028]|uniref:hypothetical protein n=1 Tax=Streptomyces sp. T028 TaxID=3394379 RepID=UPI003A845A76